MARFVLTPGLDEKVALMIAPEVTVIAKKVEIRAKLNAPAAKRWVAIADGATRFSHLAANGQTVPENLRFAVPGTDWDIAHGLSVGTDFMKGPKDTSTGLPPDAVQNVHCRCTEALLPSEIADRVETGPTRVYGTEVRVDVVCTAVLVIEAEYGDVYPTVLGAVTAPGTHFMGRAAAQVAATS